MPKKTPTLQFMLNQLRAMAQDKKVPPTTRLRAIRDGIALYDHMQNGVPLFTRNIQYRDEEGGPGSGNKPEAVPVGTDNLKIDEKSVADEIRMQKFLEGRNGIPDSKPSAS